MESMNISLPEAMKKFVDQQVEKGRYSSASELIRNLIRDLEKRMAQEWLEEQLLEGLRSPESNWTKQDMIDIRNEALARLKAKGHTIKDA